MHRLDVQGRPLCLQTEMFAVYKGLSVQSIILENAVNERCYFPKQTQSNEHNTARIRSESSSCTPGLAVCE